PPCRRRSRSPFRCRSSTKCSASATGWASPRDCTNDDFLESRRRKQREPGEPAWTDGRVVFVDAGIGRRAQVEAVAVQASLLAAGSLDPDVVRRLTRRPALARRYLA